MTLHAYLENLRAKPEAYRKRYAFWTSFGLTAIIAAFYIASYSGININPGSAVSKAVASAGSPSESLVAGAGAAINDLWNAVVGPRKVTYSEVQVLPGNQ